MKLITQPEGSTVCGQCCVAMIVGVSLNSCLTVFCHDWATSPKVLRWALKYYHYTPARRLLKIKLPALLPDLCILKLTYPFQQMGHWVVYNAGQIYCSVHGIYDYNKYEAVADGKLTHYLGFTKTK
ncbi:hypothetical protein [Hymenobacter cheonanensis]|uniref:hypothetical protein n=1 Tax=Hymenobacter sp. CA2-7 TaxID=3063993 RepID=UPI00271442DF|nr:hypothetical protein [Hymenobacter sp. CA2-7]MDO7888276.1 hypothetical protein [Hymenobacter sp. CA2-7]